MNNEKILSENGLYKFCNTGEFFFDLFESFIWSHFTESVSERRIRFHKFIVIYEQLHKTLINMPDT